MLDAGCGTGDMAIYFAKRRLKVHAIDLLPIQVSISRKNAETELGKLYKTTANNPTPTPTNAVKCLENLSIQEATTKTQSYIFQ